MNLINKIRKIVPEIKPTVDKRIVEFKKLKGKPSKEWFKELCFCLLTANYTADGGMRIQKSIGNGFITLQEKELAKELRRLKHRFPNARAHYIASARKYTNCIKKIIENKSTEEKREWLIQNIKGLGMKEASHFLRNLSYLDYAIIDRHILRMLKSEYKIPDKLNKKNYMLIEDKLKKIADKLNLKQGQLDLYIWYLATGKVLK